ncbi:hypothetical protein NLX85_21975 [Micromonospora sp. A3M-1-15]|uniref:hypothetical protein n=1 Tax=Micromonospora sp. A3M-1-15 TaxID=2962035 RepID=UPI0020B65331|nr:hypothetical protein [Micromonospora sp. A3M-1-15]MCP3786036.1 hypothetical protein [Micromonospora sp. A3M-1-15]
MPEIHMTRSERRAIEKAWRQVPFATRLDVLRSTKRGQPYPDPAVDMAAVQYAHLVLGQKVLRHAPGFLLAAGFLVIAVAVMAGNSTILYVGGACAFLLSAYVWDLRRDAKKIAAVPRNDPPDA